MLSARMSPERSCRGLFESLVFETRTLPIVELPGREELWHPCANLRTITISLETPRLVFCVRRDLPLESSTQELLVARSAIVYERETFATLAGGCSWGLDV